MTTSVEAPLPATTQKRPGWVPAAVLALPFALMVGATRGLTLALPIFHGSDERVYHLPTILRFGAQLPFPDLSHYAAAQAPLFHLLLAVWGKLVGYEPWRLRVLVVLISYGAALALYRLLIGARGLTPTLALVLALLYALSPYVFGVSFRVVTDNLAMLLILLALERLERFRIGGGRPGSAFALACLWISGALLTRQSAAFMLGVGLIYLVWASPQRRPAGVGALVLAVAPLVALVAVWHGFVPPGSDPNSCGLCAAKGRESTGLFTHAAGLTIAVAGLYGAVLFAPVRWARGHAGHFARRRVLPGAAAGAVFLLCFPMRVTGFGDAGYLWEISRHAPVVLGSSLLFWVLVPLGGAVLAARWSRPDAGWLSPIFLGCFLVASLATRLAFEKYVDAFALLALIFTVRPDELTGRREWIGPAFLLGGFVAYAVVLAN